MQWRWTPTITQPSTKSDRTSAHAIRSGPCRSFDRGLFKGRKARRQRAAWAMNQKSTLLMGRGSYADAKSLLNQSLRLSPDPAAQGEANYRLGYSRGSWGIRPRLSGCFASPRSTHHRSALGREAAYCWESSGRMATIRRKPSPSIRECFPAIPNRRQRRSAAGLRPMPHSSGPGCRRIE